MFSSARWAALPLLLRRAGALGGLLALASAGCRTAAAPLPTAAPARDHSEQACPAIAAYFVEQPVRIVVTPRVGPFLVLGAGPVQLGSRTSWSITYQAAPDRASADAPDSRERLGVTAEILRLTYELVAEAAGADILAVTAVFGAPGESGTTEQITYIRGGETWQRTPGTSRGELRLVPSFPPVIDRVLDVEKKAMRIALEFLGAVDRAQYDAAWDLSSAVVKATLSRARFQDQLRALVSRPGTERHELYQTLPVLADGLIPGSELEVWFVRHHGARSSVESVLLRLDDDMELRVAAVKELVPTEPARYGSVTRGP
jgi:hypothetical protein